MSKRLAFSSLATLAALTLLHCSGSDIHPPALDTDSTEAGPANDATVGSSMLPDTSTSFDSALGADSNGPDSNPPDMTDASGSDANDGSSPLDGSDDGAAPFDAGADAEMCTDFMINCGGNCGPCPTNGRCKVGADCASLSCPSGQCLAPSCSDGIKNGNEVDVDCGGPNCGACSDGRQCVVDGGCTSGVCSACGGPPRTGVCSGTGTCQVPTCADQVKNGVEGDVDCGGACTTKCFVGKTCNAALDCNSNLCSGAGGSCFCPSGMVVMPGLDLAGRATGAAYCVDATEVTYNQYAVFWSANPSPAGQIAQCSWNTSYTPSANWPQGPGTAGLPVTYVDWCDAFAFCHYAGKRLCGAIGGKLPESPQPPASDNDKYTDEWFNACSALGSNSYPYGSAYNGQACVGADYNANNQPPFNQPPANPNVVASPPNCLGGAPGMYDMSGNVAEWEDSCSASSGAGDTCAIRGGSFKSNSVGLACNASASTARNTQAATVGFRCCL